MTGVKGAGGPVPKRSTQRRRRNKDTVEVATEKGASKVPVPRPDPSWHKVAKRWYNSLRHSGQAVYYEPSDWATAFLLAESMSRDLNEQVVGINDRGEVVQATLPLKGANLSAYLKAMSSLLVTEGDRRRMRLELERPKVPTQNGEGNVSWLADARKRTGGAS